jgi:hypothetical protein
LGLNDEKRLDGTHLKKKNIPGNKIYIFENGGFYFVFIRFIFFFSKIQEIHFQP